MEFKDLTEEQKAKVAACETTDDIFKLAREEGVDLSDEDLEAIAGGWSALDGVDIPEDNGYKLRTL